MIGQCHHHLIGYKKQRTFGEDEVSSFDMALLIGPGTNLGGLVSECGQDSQES